MINLIGQPCQYLFGLRKMITSNYQLKLDEMVEMAEMYVNKNISNCIL